MMGKRLVGNAGKVGCPLFTKLRSILLMEADFNATNKIIYGVWMLENVRKYKLMPEEIYSERNRLADDGTLAKSYSTTSTVSSVDRQALHR
jgi:hypothetical protein